METPYEGRKRRKLNRDPFGADAQRVTDGVGEALGEAEVALLRSGDEAAFAALFDRHAQEVYRYCVRRSEPQAEDSRAAAEDLVSVVFLEAWRCRSRAVAVDGSFRPWLFGIARNVTRAARRSAFRHRAALRRFHALPPEAGSAETADVAGRTAERVDAERSALLLEQAVHGLSPGDRDVAELCLLQQMGTAAAAAVLGIPEGTVKSRLSRVRGRWQRVLRTGENATQLTPSGHESVERPPVAPVGRT